MADDKASTRGENAADPDAVRVEEIRSRLAGLPDPIGFLERLFAFAPVGFQIFKADGRSLLTNRAFRDMFGSEPPPEYNVLVDEIAKAQGVLELIHRSFAGETVQTPPVWYDPSQLTQVAVTGKRVGIAATFFPLFDAAHAVTHVGIVFKDVTEELLAKERAEKQLIDAEAARKRASFLAKASGALSESLDYAQTLKTVARLAVPAFADWCTVVIADEAGTLRRLVVHHKDPSKAALVAEYETNFPPEQHRAQNLTNVRDSRATVLVEKVGPDYLASAAQSATHLRVLEGLGVSSCILVPVLAGTKVLGIISLMRSEGSASYDNDDVVVAEALAARASLAIENARLFSAEQRARKEADEIFESMGDAFFALDTDYRILRVNAEQERVSKMPRSQTIGRIFWELWPETATDTSAYWREYRRCMQERVPVQFVEHYAPLKVWTDVRAFPVADGGIAVFFRDVTARMTLERDLRRVEAEYRALVENLPELAWSAQPDGHIDYYNQRWFEYTGTTLEQMQGWGWERVHDPAILPKVVERWKQSLQTGAPFEMEFPLRGADGEFRWFLTRVRPLRDDKGNIARWFGTNTNIDEQRRQAAELQEAIAVRETFLSVASHELKTPLTPLALKLSVLEREAQRRAPDDPLAVQVLNYGETARRQITRLRSLVDDLLDVSRIEAKRFPIEPDDVDYAAVLREVALRFDLEAERVGSALIVEVPESLPGRSDRLRLEQVVTNLIDNALKYGGGKPVKVSLTSSGSEVVLIVADQGIGIAPDKREVIFQKFERAVSARNYGGLGLGLFITRTVVEGLRGTISVESEPGAGATFTVRLPTEIFG